MSTLDRKRLKQWLLICLRIGALSFGGGGRALMYKTALVEDQKWLSDENFQEIYTVASVFPGPNIINLVAYVGYKFFGIAGAISGVALLTFPGASLALVILWFVPLQNPDILRAFQGFTIGSVLLIFVLVAQLLKGLQKSHNSAKVHSTKLALRVGLFTLITGASLMNIPFLIILGGGAFLGLLLEFFL